jgi:peptidoglycan/LPS O-acetylase OafA/YrhL
MLQDNPVIKLNVVCKPFLGNSPLWSLTYEWWFYMSFYFFTYFIKKNTSFWVYVICICSAISYMFYPFIVNRTLTYLLIWWIGTDIAKLYLSGLSFNFKNLWRQLAVLLLCIGILVVNLIINKDEWSRQLHVDSPGFSPWLEVRHFVCAFIVIVSALIWRKLNWFGFSAIFGIFEKIAPISFGVYISHYFLLSYATYLDFIPNMFLRYTLYAIICLAFSYLVERIIYIKLNKAIMNRYYYNKAKTVSV